MADDPAGLDLALVDDGVPGRGAIPDCSLGEWEVMRLNVDSAFRTLRAAVRGRPGSIVLTALAAAVKAEPRLGPMPR